MAPPTSSKPNGVVTLGDPSGIGPEVAVRALARLSHTEQHSCEIIVSPTQLQEILGRLASLPSCQEDVAGLSRGVEEGRYTLLDPGLPWASLMDGAWNEGNVPFIERSLILGLERCLETGSALVTPPSDKRFFSALGMHEAGHTEFLAHVLGASLEPVMLFDLPDFCLSIMTRHIPLSRVTRSVGLGRLRHHAGLMSDYLKLRLANRLAPPRIAVLGLDPHCGEWGDIGSSDLKVAGWVKRLSKSGLSLEGPVPSDTLFVPDRLERVDGILAWYHDQGMIPVKLLGFKEAVNVTLGLSVLRTSPAHGVAYDRAGTGTASPDSMARAITLGIQLSSLRRSGLKEC